MSYYCNGCGKDITSWVDEHFDDYEPVPDDIDCVSCRKYDEQLNKGRDDE